MHLVLMHGAGNAFAVLDGFRSAVPADAETSRLAVEVSRSLGRDGLLVVGPDHAAAARMRIFNADGSEAEMCGNGLRCVGRLLSDRGYVAGREFVVATAAGPRAVEVRADGRVRVSLGRPAFDAAAIPTTLPGRPPVEVPLAGLGVSVTCLSLGNPHAVTFVGDADRAPVRRLGPAVERHPAFPRRANIGFAEVVSRSKVRLRVWERGVGETAACGTGAAAAAVAGTLTGRTGRTVTVVQRGGLLAVDRAGDEVLLTGEAVETGAVAWPAAQVRAA